MDTVLLVEDDKFLRHTLKENLENEDFIVFEAAAGKRLTEIVRQHHVDLILLDLRLPDGNGLDFIRDIRQHTDVPVIIVSGENRKAEKLEGLETGADDYVCKPFEMDELIARIKANLRRYKGQTSNENSKEQPGAAEIKCGPWTLDRARYQIFDPEGRPGNLTFREFRLLDILAEKTGQAVKRDDLCEALREENYTPTPRALDVAITRIRKKIGDSGTNPEIIKTVRGVGYMLTPAT